MHVRYVRHVFKILYFYYFKSLLFSFNQSFIGQAFISPILPVGGTRTERKYDLSVQGTAEFEKRTFAIQSVNHCNTSGNSLGRKQKSTRTGSAEVWGRRRCLS